MAEAVKTKPKEKSKKKPTHEVRMILKDKVYIGRGFSTHEALKDMKQPPDLKSFATIETVVEGKLIDHPKRLVPIKIKRLFANDWEMQLLAKQLDILR